MGEQELHIVLLSNDPQRAYPAFQLAMGAAAMGHKARIYATTAGLDLLRKGAADKVQLPGYPPLGQVLRDAIKYGAEVCACAASTVEIVAAREAAAASSIPILAERNGYAFTVTEHGGVWRLLVTNP